MPSFGNLFASLTLESASFMSGMKAAQKQLAATQKTFATVGGNITKVGAAMSVGITAPFTALLSAAVPAAVESQQALAQVNAALASMGPVAGRTADQLQALAGRLQDTSNFDDDDILKSVTANLLTFGKVTGETFDRASQAAVNLSARLGQDLQSSAIQVGKALNEPIKGVTALQRVGVSFTAQQKEQIAAMVQAGDVAGAQGIILGELEKQFGGAAAAQRAATPTAAMDQAWRTFQETVGAVGLKVLPPLTKALAGLLDAFNHLSPGAQNAAIYVGAAAAAVGPFTTAVGLAVQGIGLALPALVKFGAGFAGLEIAEGGATGGMYAFGIATKAAMPWLAAITGAVALGYAAYQHWDDIKAIAQRVVGYMRELYVGVKTWISDKLNAIFSTVVTGIQKVHDAFNWLTDKVTRHSYVPEMVDEIAHQYGRLQGIMVDPALAAAGQVNDAFKGITAPPITSVGEPGDETTSGPGSAPSSNDNGKPVATMTKLADVLRQVGEAGGGAFERVVDGIARMIDAVTQAKGATADLSTTLSDVGGLFQSIFGKKVGGILGAIAKIGMSVAGAFGGARAAGGPVLPGQTYLVGERGPELLRMGGASGSIVPNHQIGAGRSVSFDLRGAVMTGDLLRQMQAIAADTGGRMIAGNERNRALKMRQAIG